MVMMLTVAHNKEIPKVDSNHTCLAVIILDSALKKRWELLSASVSKRVKIHWGILMIIWVIFLMILMKKSCQVNVFWESIFEYVFFWESKFVNVIFLRE